MDKHGITEEEDLPDFFVTTQTLNPHIQFNAGAIFKNVISII